MRSVDPELFRKWKSGLDELNRIDLEARRKASYRDRFKSLVSIWRQAAFLGHLKEEPIDLSVNDTWQRLRKAYHERHA